MGTTLNRIGYVKLIKGDLKYLLKQEPTLERDHIEQVLKSSINLLYGKENKKANILDETIRCECADHQGGPCAFCMEAKHNL